MTIDEFIAELGALDKPIRDSFTLSPVGFLRGVIHNRTCCPICLLCEAKGKGLYETPYFRSAAIALSLTADDTITIADAADGRVVFGDEAVRKRMLACVGLKENK